MENKEKTLIIGAGEIGLSLGNVLSSAYDVKFYDPIKGLITEERFDIINICYPYNDKFIEITKNYIEKFQPKLTIVHSTVPVGTTRKIGGKIIHSPVNGRHPRLEEGIKTFTKFVGGLDGESIYSALEFLRKAGIKTSALSSPEATEMAKIFCTTYYGWNLIFQKELLKLCEENNLPFHEVYTIWNTAYNEGYLKLGEIRFIRPVLNPIGGEIGGHCVIPNCDLFQSFLTDTIKGRNNGYKRISEPSTAGVEIRKTENGQNRKRHKNLASRIK